MKKPNLGRPRKAMPKSKTLEFRLSNAEKKAFQDAADFAGIGLSAWIRERLRQCAIRELEDAGLPIAFLQETTQP